MSVYLNERFQYVNEDGERYASISQILRDVGIKKSWDKDGPPTPDVQVRIDHAAWRGKEVEKHCFEIARFNFTDCPDDDEISVRVSAFNDWWNANDLEYVSHHEIVWDEEARVAHELDLVVLLDGKLTTVDIKCTASVEKDWGIQCGAQSGMRYGMTGEDHNMAVLHLKPQFKKGYIYRSYGEAEPWLIARGARIESLGLYAKAKEKIGETL
mgnify:CR=1 FL=1